VAHDIRDTILDFIAHWSERTEIRALQLVDWIALSGSKFYSWRDRYGKVGEHNDLVPRDHWLEPWEKVAIISFHQEFPLEGYRRLTFMMLDRDVVAVSPSSTYRVTQSAFPGALGIACRDDGARRRDRSAASSRKISGYFPADHHRQRSAVYCQGL
jgi:hypothetical protein